MRISKVEKIMIAMSVLCFVIFVGSIYIAVSNMPAAIAQLEHAIQCERLAVKGETGEGCK